MMLPLKGDGLTEPRMISADALAHGHALSFADQPYLSTLFQTIKAKRRQLILVVGAGVSMNAGLPSWSGLVANMTEAVTSDLKPMALASTGDSLERRAETIIQIACAANANLDARQVMRDALFYKGLVPTPGILAMSIGRLAAQYFPAVSILTTNFDEVLERALSHYLPNTAIQPYSMDSYAEWVQSEARTKELGVLHLHGVLRQGGAPHLGPVVLTDSDFLEHGARVREAVKAAVTDEVTVFIGMSLTDPNIVSPLFDYNGGTNPVRYGLFVPRLHGDGFDPVQHAQYALAGAEFLRAKLHLRPIFPKSYSQLNQVVSDLGLATMEPNLYRRNISKDQSLHYGARFKAALTNAYDRIGANSRTGELTTDLNFTLSRQLQDAFNAHGGPGRLLKKFRAKYRGAIAEKENFGLFLWLRTLDRDGAKAYSLTLAGTSVYMHLESWSGRREEAITGNSNYAAVHAIFEGSVKVENLEPSRNGGTWRGAVAIPLIANFSRSNATMSGDPLDSLVIGALTLDSTCFVDAKDKDVADVSVLSQLPPNEFQAIVDSLSTVMGLVLAAP